MQKSNKNQNIRFFENYKKHKMTSEAADPPKVEATVSGGTPAEQEKKALIEDVTKIEKEVKENIKPESTPKRVRRQNPETEEYNYYYSEDELAQKEQQKAEEKPNTDISLKGGFLNAIGAKPEEQQPAKTENVAGETLAEKLLDNNPQPAEKPPESTEQQNKEPVQEQNAEKQENKADNENNIKPIDNILKEKLLDTNPTKPEDTNKPNPEPQTTENNSPPPPAPEKKEEKPKPSNMYVWVNDLDENNEEPDAEPQKETKSEENKQPEPTENQSFQEAIKEKIFGENKDEENNKQNNEENPQQTGEENKQENQDANPDAQNQQEENNVNPNDAEKPEEEKKPEEPQEPQKSPEEKELEDAMDDMINKFQAPPPHLRARIRQIISHKRVDAIVAGKYEEAELQDRYERALAISLQTEQERANEDNRMDILYARYVQLQERLQEVNSKYDTEIKNYNESSLKLQQQMKERHQQELEDFTKKWNDEKFLIQFNKPSAKLLQLREMEKARALSRLYQKAKEIKIIADRLQNEETQAAQRRINNQMENEKKKLLIRQQKEIQSNEEHRGIAIQNINMRRDTEIRPIQVAINQIRAKKGTIVVAGKPSSQAVTRDFADADKSPLSPRTHEKLNNYRAVKPKPRLSVHGAEESKPNSPKNRPKTSAIKRPFTASSHKGKFAKK